MTGRINYTPEARRQLHELHEWIVGAAGSGVAEQFLRALLSHIEALLVFPRAGRDRGDLRPGMRTSTYKRRTLIAYGVDESGDEVIVEVIGVFHGGQDWESVVVAEAPEADR